MTKQEAINLIKLRLGSREDSDLDALVAAELALSQETLEASPPYYWFCQKDDTGRQLVAETNSLAEPDDFIIEIEECVLEISIDGVSFTEVVKSDYDDLLRNYRESGPGLPKHYALVNNTLYFGPTPDQAYYIRQKYHGRDTSITVVTSDGTNNWLTIASDVLIAHAGISVSAWIKDSSAMQMFTGKYTEAKNRLATLHEARMETNHSRRSES
jgi:hypothetical protein